MLNKLDEDDDWKVNIVWTDIQKSDEQNDIERAGLSELSEQGGAGRDHIFMSSGADSGKCVDRN